MEKLTAEQSVIEGLAMGKINLEIENLRLRHRIAELEGQSTDTDG